MSKLGFRKGRETSNQIANICWIKEKAREFQKNIYFCFIDYGKPLTVFSSVQLLSRDRLFATPWIAVRQASLSEKAMAPHSSTLAWKIPWMEDPGRLQSMWSLRVGHDWATSLSLFTFMHWRRKWQPTPVFLPGESQGRGSLVGCRLWGRTESDTTEAT